MSTYSLFRISLPLLTAAMAMAQGVTGSAAAERAGSEKGTKAQYIQPSQVRSEIRDSLIAAGDRLQKPGNERVTLQGTWTDASGTRCPATLTWEIGQMVRLDRNCGNQKTIRYDGDASSSSEGAITSSDAQILQSLVDDLPDTVLAMMAGPSLGFQLIGRRFPMREGGYCDYYEVPMLSATRKGSSSTVRICFDSTTHWLRKVLHPAGAGAPSFTTTFSDWRTVNGQIVPGTITRTERTGRVFSFEAQQVAIAPQSKDNIFSSATK